VSLPRWGWPALVATLAILATGCSIAPKSFQKINDPAAITRARSVSLGGRLPQRQVVPSLIDRLEDPDRVVRLAAYEELRKNTGKTFGYRPWASDTERMSAVQRWRAWWNEKQAGLFGSGRSN
jgi:HEAT repeat protein